MDENSLLYWYPKIKDLGILTPRTEIVKLIPKEKSIYYSGEDGFFRGLEYRTSQVIRDEFELPVFLRTDQFSGKHSWKKSCYLDNLENVSSNLSEILIGSREVNFLGPLPIEAIAVRKFIPMNNIFYAFSGDMPVNPERRYFIRDGKVECHHAYWIGDAVEKGTSKEKLPNNWKDIARQMNMEDSEEVGLLTEYSQKVADVMSGYWSVDFCKSKEGDWVLIDMALGEDSWHPSECSKR